MRRTKHVNIPITKNADFEVTIFVPTGGLPTNLTGYTFKGQIRSTTDLTPLPAADFTFTIKDQILETGYLLWSMPKAITKDIPASVANSEMPEMLETPYLYDVYMTDNLNKTFKILQGKAFVIPDVTSP